MVAINMETPSLTIGVGAHNLFLVARGAINVVDGTIAETNNHGVSSVTDVDSANQATEADGVLLAHVTSVPDNDIAIIATSDHSVGANTLDRADETFVSFFGLCAAISIPNIEFTVGTTSVAAAIGIEGNAREGGAGCAVIETVLLLSAFIPETNVLTASSGKIGGTGLSVESQVKNFVV